MSVRAGVDQASVQAVDAASPELLGIVERQLEAEFSGRLDASDIRHLAMASLTRFDDAPVRTFVPILAIREARRIARGHLGETTGR
jgi:hypothetical protein